MTKYIQEYSVICSDIDLNSQMKPIATPIYFQDCFIRYAARHYCATFDIEPKNMFWFIADYNIYLTENLPFWSENFTVETWISKITKLKVFVDFVYIYKGKTFAKGRSTWILFDNTKKKPIFTDVLLEKYKDIEEELPEMIDKILWNDIKEPVRAIEHIANRTDLDFNGHVNNRSYINIAITTASEEIQENYYIKQLAVKFLHQSFINDKLECTSYLTEKEKEYITNIKTANNDVCNIYTAWEPKTHTHNILDCDLAVRNNNQIF